MSNNAEQEVAFFAADADETQGGNNNEEGNQHAEVVDCPAKKRKIDESLEPVGHAPDAPIVHNGGNSQDLSHDADPTLAVYPPMESLVGTSADDDSSAAAELPKQTPLTTQEDDKSDALSGTRKESATGEGVEEKAVAPEPTFDNSLLYNTEPTAALKPQDDAPAIRVFGESDKAAAVAVGEGDSAQKTESTAGQQLPSDAVVESSLPLTTAGGEAQLNTPVVATFPDMNSAPTQPVAGVPPSQGFGVGESPHFATAPLPRANYTAEKTSQGRSETRQMVPPGTIGISDVRESDVLSGRGGGTNCHPGNRSYRDLINVHRRTYLKARKNDKPSISRSIVKTVRDANGRFLRKDDTTNMWFEIGDEAAREKTSQALRQRAPEMRKLIFDSEREDQQYRAQQEEQFRLQQMSQMNHPHMSSQAFMTMGMAPNGVPMMNPMFAMAMANGGQPAQAYQGLIHAAMVNHQATQVAPEQQQGDKGTDSQG
mmetsp:Transcript_28973/g.79477  ORF Transcript_28973/g.79477 Transcript_28973/m.79477 type:complete len:484 (+) Transcript_28973:83-1534(+)